MNGSDTTCPELQERIPSAQPPREPQDLFHLLLNQLPVGIFQKDREGRYVFVNSYFCRHHGATAEDYLGKTAEEVIVARGAGDKAGQTGKLRQFSPVINGASHHALIMQTGKPIEDEEHYCDSDGRDFWFHAIKGPLFGPDGAIIGSQGILVDITERKRAEAQFANERDLLRALLDSSPDAIYFKDRQSRFLRCSASMTSFFHVRSTDEIIGKTDFDYQGEAHAREAFEDEQNIIRTGKPLIGKTEKEQWPDGHVTWSLTSKMPLRNSGGEIIGTVGVSKNITPFKEAEAKVDQLHKQLLQTSREAGMAEVATSILHNVGNVLNSVNVSASLVLENVKKSKVSSLARAVALLNEHAANLPAYLADDPKGRQFPGYLNLLCGHLTSEQQSALAELELIRENVEHVKEIVAMQQNYARISGVTETVKVAEIVEDALRMNAGALVRHEVAVIREYRDDPTVSIEKHKVLQILVNLIRNAKYACDDSGRKDKHIRLKICKGDQDVSIAVIDNGIGIPQENFNRIFNYGFTTRKEGHGFGLHSGALTAKELGGSLTVSSEGPGFGAHFTLKVPPQPPARDKIAAA
jgi:PAS domain S-box-containing protein